MAEKRGGGGTRRCAQRRAGGYAALGLLVGRLLPPLVAVAACGLLGFVVPVVLGSEVDWTLALFTVANDGFLGGPAPPRTTTLLLQGLFFGLTALASGAAAAWLVRRTAIALATATALSVLAAASGVVPAAVGQTKTVWLVGAEGPRSCSDDQVVCVWSDHATLRDRYAVVGRRMPAGAPPAVAVRGWTETGLSRLPAHADVYLAAAVQNAAFTGFGSVVLAVPFGHGRATAVVGAGATTLLLASPSLPPAPWLLIDAVADPADRRAVWVISTIAALAVISGRPRPGLRG